MREELKKFYLDWVNNFRSAELMASYYNMSYKQTTELLLIAQQLYKEDT